MLAGAMWLVVAASVVGELNTPGARTIAVGEQTLVLNEGDSILDTCPIEEAGMAGEALPPVICVLPRVQRERAKLHQRSADITGLDTYRDERE